MKRIEIDGKLYRRRRGKLVEIPPEWAGHTVHAQTINKRLSKGTSKLRKRRWSYNRQPHPRNMAPRHNAQARDAEHVEITEGGALVNCSRGELQEGGNKCS